MAEGADLDFARAVLALREDEKYITLEATLPYPISPSKRSTEYKDGRDEILMRCNRKTIVPDHYYRGCMPKRNRYMVDHSDILLAIWYGAHLGRTWSTIEYARSKGKPIRYFMLNDFSDKQ